ncbi:AtpZ/AtpI family protein [Ulvibacter antarcticus]|uniref:Putative F0F1-ATPase subunit (Ca2+/Mg2+ transporter) n=1 Tax=Ulvibacter antarcticus TaxID=442714 RepID=A0A3L9Z1S1_9FLAO|nr:AtpZ/AtpI family protein [Ulvibacter antarcticus]RMA65957.1 putative F0F1-ATPase subunit (Ca2+/Mg2+ transporter) [Ulvibacter antarcticus]
MDKKGNNNLKRWAVLSAIAIEMGVIIYLFVQLGKWLDLNYSDGKLFTIICTLAGVGISLFLVVKQTNRLNS